MLSGRKAQAAAMRERASGLSSNWRRVARAMPMASSAHLCVGLIAARPQSVLSR